MQTRYFDLRDTKGQQKIIEDQISAAADILRQGGLVGIPTETVYGLGANALDADAVTRIFEAKGRPQDNPLITHVSCVEEIPALVRAIPDAARKLMDAFWPGPMTLILPKADCIPRAVSAGLDTVGIRLPSDANARALIAAAGRPIAAPSANRSGRPSPTTAQHVLEDMDGRIPLILDGGSCDVGVESTVLDVTSGAPCILRPGGITKDMLEGVLGHVDVAGSVLRPLQKGEKALSPGMRYKHYSPDGQVTLVEGAEADVVAAMAKLAAHADAQGHRACVMCFTEHMDALKDCHPHDIGSRDNASEVAHRLFDTLRRLDEEHMDVIFSEVVPPEGVGLAVMNRLGRAAAFHTIQARDVLKDEEA